MYYCTGKDVKKSYKQEKTVVGYGATVCTAHTVLTILIKYKCLRMARKRLV